MAVLCFYGGILGPQPRKECTVDTPLSVSGTHAEGPLAGHLRASAHALLAPAGVAALTLGLPGFSPECQEATP